MNRAEAIQLINQLAKDQQEFFVLIDFEAINYQVFNAEQIKNQEILFSFPTASNYTHQEALNLDLKVSFKKPVLKQYAEKFQKVQKEINYGNSYLCNLTSQTEIHSNANLLDIFHLADAKYKIHYPSLFTCFSPETFIKIHQQKISTYPMKGTENDPQSLLADKKEAAEHATIVDLLRNDLSLVSENVTVKNYRYLDEIKSHDSRIYFQSSSEISGDLAKNYIEKLGEIITTLLPAGSVTGAPKTETIRIIKETENYDRGYYTGIAGYFDGKAFDSCVMIRFIEEKENKQYFKSGGGITAESNLEKEYQELLGKIYVPVSRNN